MDIILDGQGGKELSRGSNIVRGQNASKTINVKWLKGCSPVEQNKVLQENFVVRVCITRPDGQQSGWQKAHKVDNQQTYYYPLQDWDTQVDGKANVSVQWYDCSIDAIDEYGDLGRPIDCAPKSEFIIDDCAIAQPVGITSENYDNLVNMLNPIEAQAFRKFDATKIPTLTSYQPDGKKDAPAIYYNATMTIKQYNGATNSFNEKSVIGTLFVGVKEIDAESDTSEQSEMFIVGDKVYMRNLVIVDYCTDAPKVTQAGEFYDLSQTVQDYVNYQITNYGYDKLSIDKMFNSFVTEYQTYLQEWYHNQRTEFDNNFDELQENFDKEFESLNNRMSTVEHDSLIRIAGTNISDADLINKVTSLKDGLYIVNTEQFGDEIIIITQNNELIARYTATGASYQLDKDIMDWEMSAGGGGGGGGGGTGSNIRLTALSGLQMTTAVGAETLLTYNFKSSVPGKGTAKYFVNDALKATTVINQGNNSFDATNYIANGSTNIKVTVTDTAGSSATLEYIVEGVELKLTSAFDDAQSYTGNIEYRYLISGDVPKTVHFVIDGVEQDPITIESTRQQTYTIPALSHGLHTFSVYAEAEINGFLLPSNELTYNLIAYESGNSDVIIASKFNQTSATEGEIVAVDYIVYDPSNANASVELLINDTSAQTLTVNRTKQYWYIRNLNVGTNKLTIKCGEKTVDFEIDIAESDFNIAAVTEGLELYLTADGKSNSSTDKENWAYGDYKAEFSNLNWSTNGWMDDKGDGTGNPILRLNGAAQVTIPFKIFEKDFRTYGKTIEFEFMAKDVATIDTVAIVSYADNKGIKLKMNEALIQSEQSSVNAKYKDDEKIRLSFVIDSKDDLRLIRTFVNGVLSGATQYPANDNFQQTNPVGITINPDGGSIDIYNIRIYDTALSDVDILHNYIADYTATEPGNRITEQMDLYNKNDIYDANGNVVYTKVKGKIPTVVITGTLPSVKGDKKTCTVSYENPLNISRNFETTATVDVQGTSSQGYPRKNWKIKLPNEIDFFGNGLKEDTYTIKVNYMESGNRNNTGIANFIHGANGQIYAEKVPPQENNANIRTVIDGEDIILFHKATASSTPKFYAMGQFNNDKGNANTLGLTNEYPNAESWEFKDNDEPLCLFKSNDFSRNANAFEARYPDKNTDYTQIDALVDWVYSTTGDVDKFKTEFEQHFNLHYTLMYYVLTEVFGMVDSRAKNMFLNTWDGVIWYPVFYDMDTALGLNNEGVNVFDPDIEYNDKIGSQNVYNGSTSVLWNNFKAAFADEIKELYTQLRSDGKLTAGEILSALDAVTSNFSKALYNADAQSKYIDPLIENGDATYLYCAQGDRREHFKLWIDRRLKYLDSKYYASEYADDYVMMRIYSPSDTTTTSAVAFNGAFTLKSFIPLYMGVRYGANGELFQVRAKAETSTTVKATTSIDLNDKETYIYGASKIKDLGDLASKYVGTLDVSKATQLTKLVVGSSKTKYSNTNLIELKIGNNNKLNHLDIRNCPSLTQAIDLSGCDNIQEVYATGTSIPSVTLADGGNLRVITLPATITNLTLKNQPLIETITMAGYTNVSTLVVENCNEKVDPIITNIVQNSTALSRVRLINIDWNLTDKTFLEKLMQCGGIDENNNNTDKSIVTGKVYVGSIGQSDIDRIKAYFPNLTLTYGTLIEQFTVTFTNWDGTVLDVQAVDKGGAAVDPITRKDNPIATPTRERDAQYTYTYSGWGSILTGVYTDRTIVAQYSTTINSYTVNFYNNSSGTAELLYTQTVDYGSAAKYTGDRPVYQGAGEGTYLFGGWSPSVQVITGNTDAYAIFNEMVVPETVKTLEECTPAEIKAISMLGTKNDSNQWTVGDNVWFEVGDTKTINLLNGETLTLQIADFNHDTDANGNVIPITFVTKELLKDSKRMNATNTNAGGWANSEMYSYIQGTVWDWIPDEWKVIITPAVKKSTEGSQSTNILTSVDNLFLLSYTEAGLGTDSPYGDEGTKYPIFTNTTSRKKYKVGSSSATNWWVRSPNATNSTNFRYVGSSGGANGSNASNTYGVCFAFCV